MSILLIIPLLVLLLSFYLLVHVLLVLNSTIPRAQVRDRVVSWALKDYPPSLNRDPFLESQAFVRHCGLDLRSAEIYEAARAYADFICSRITPHRFEEVIDGILAKRRDEEAIGPAVDYYLQLQRSQLNHSPTKYC
jgi:hypothetical protein